MMESNHSDELANHNRGSSPASRDVKIEELVRELVRVEGSDLHLKPGVPPGIRLNGVLQPLEGFEPLYPSDTEGILKEILPQKLAEEFEDEGEVDFSYEVSGLGRFRVNAF